MQLSCAQSAPAQLCFDQVGLEDDEITLIRGPLGTPHLMRWSAAVENWHKIHYDQPFATGHDGLPGLLVNGSLKQQFLLHLLKDWAGPSGFVWKVSFQFRAMTLVGDSLTLWARPVTKTALEDFGLVELELGIRNSDGSETTPGRAIVALPYDVDRPVPYPFVPPVLSAAGVPA